LKTNKENKRTISIFCSGTTQKVQVAKKPYFITFYECNENIDFALFFIFVKSTKKIRVPRAELAGPDTPLDESTLATFIGQKIKYLVASNIDAVFSMSGKAIAGCEVEFLCAEEDKLYTVSIDCSGENVELDVDYGEPDPAVIEKINECQSRHCH